MHNQGPLKLRAGWEGDTVQWVFTGNIDYNPTRWP